MHIWPSKKVMKTSKLWHTQPPAKASAEDMKKFKAEEREYKYTMLGIVTKEKKTTGKNQKN